MQASLVQTFRSAISCAVLIHVPHQQPAPVAKLAGMASPSTPARSGPASSYGFVTGYTPQLVLPPMTMSPGITRLDRVLDLVTEHESQFREVELRVVDLSSRVARVEQVIGFSWGGSLGVDSVAVGFGVRNSAARDVSSGVVQTPHEHKGHASNDVNDTNVFAQLRETRGSISNLRHEIAAALDELLGELLFVTTDTGNTKTGFKTVLRDVLDRVAAQLDSVRGDRREADRQSSSSFASSNNYASASDLKNLTQRLSVTETKLEDITNERMAFERADTGDTASTSGMSKKVDLLTQELDRVKRDGDDLRRRVAELTLDLSEKTYQTTTSAGNKTTLSAGNSVGVVPTHLVSQARVLGSNPVSGGGGAWSKHAPTDQHTESALASLTKRFDEQTAETAALKDLFVEMKLKIDEASLTSTRSHHDDRHVVSRDPSEVGTHLGTIPTKSPRDFSFKSPPGSPLRGQGSHLKGNPLEWSSPRVTGGLGSLKHEHDGLVRLGFGAYAGAELVQAAGTKAVTLKIPKNAGFVAEASSRTAGDRAAQSVTTECVTGLP